MESKGLSPVSFFWCFLIFFEKVLMQKFASKKDKCEGQRRSVNFAREPVSGEIIRKGDKMLSMGVLDVRFT